MTTTFLWLAAFLLAVYQGIFAFSWSMAGLSTCVTTTFETLATDQTTKNICTPARLVLESLLAAKARLFGQERAFGALFFTCVAIVCHLRMTASLLSMTGEIAIWWPSAAW